jgi:hypothetical protein
VKNRNKPPAVILNAANAASSGISDRTGWILTCAALGTETSRSSLVPPNNTAIFMFFESLRG